MRPLMMPTLSLALAALGLLPAVSQADNAVAIALRPAEQVAPQVVVGKGPQGQPAIEWIGHGIEGADSTEAVSTTEALDTPPLLTIRTPAFAASNYVLRGRLKCDSVAGDARLDLMSDAGHEGCAIPGWRFSGTRDWQDFEMTVQTMLMEQAGTEDKPPAEKARKLHILVQMPGSGRVTLAGPFVIQPVVLADHWRLPEGASTTIPDSGVTVSPRAATAKGPAGEPAISVTAGERSNLTALDTGIFTLVISQNPEITSSDYVLRGRVKYDGVAGDGYLELLNDFGDQRFFFTRSLGSSGPLAKLTGTSDWRKFELPFHAEPGMKPKQLVLNVVLPGAGKVTVTQPLVVASLDLSGVWWTEQQAGIVGGGLGSFFGLLGALVGLSAAWGKSRALTMTFCGIALVLGAFSLVTGLAALCMGQPWHVTYPLLLIGCVGVTVVGGNLRSILHRFQADELRRMTAADIG